MNREIKFRVRNEATKEIIGYEWINEKGNWHHQYINDEAMFNNVFDISGIALQREQYTGLNDKNSKEIYEGDIIQGCWRPQDKYLIEWDNISGGWIYCDDCNTSKGRYADSIVIGDIFGNPELINGD